MSRNLLLDRFRALDREYPTYGLAIDAPTQPPAPFTLERLESIASSAEQLYKDLLAQHPPGTFHDGRNHAHDLMEQARHCAKWMQAKGHTSLHHVGSFDAFSYGQGDRVRIRAGASYRSYLPKFRGEPQVNARARVVTVNTIYSGYVDVHGIHARRMTSESERLIESVRQPEVVWAGTGGYWCQVNANDVELVEAAPSSKRTGRQRSAQGTNLATSGNLA